MDDARTLLQEREGRLLRLMEALVEDLADLAHEAWRGRERHREAAQRWRRQAEADCADLPEAEKAGGRSWALRHFRAAARHLLPLVDPGAGRPDGTPP